MSPPFGRVLVIGGGAMATGIAARLSAAGIETVVLVRRRDAVAAVGDPHARPRTALVEQRATALLLLVGSPDP